MGFERFRQEKEAEEQKEQAKRAQEDAERQIREAADKLEYEKQLELAEKRDEATRAFLNDSGIRSKLNELIEITGKGVITEERRPYWDKSSNPASTSNIAYFIDPIGKIATDKPYSYENYCISFPRRDPHSILDITAWRIQPEEWHHGYSTIHDKEFDSCLVVETCTDGIIKIHGNTIDPISAITIGPFRMRKGIEGLSASTIIPESIWRKNPEILEEALIKAYKSPIPILPRKQTYQELGE